jgi:hypothetical protein
MEKKFADALCSALGTQLYPDGTRNCVVQLSLHSDSSGMSSSSLNGASAMVTRAALNKGERER